MSNKLAFKYDNHNLQNSLPTGKCEECNVAE